MYKGTSSFLLSILARLRRTLVYSAGIFILVTEFAHAAVLVAVDDSYGIPPSWTLQIEPFVVLENDTHVFIIYSELTR